MTPAAHGAATGQQRGDRFHFIARQIERLDDRAFAALLAWFDGYADSRWQGRCAMNGGVVAPMAVTSVGDRCAGAVPPPPLAMASTDSATTDLPALEWIACEPAAPRGYAQSRERR